MSTSQEDARDFERARVDGLHEHRERVASANTLELQADTGGRHCQHQPLLRLSGRVCCQDCYAQIPSKTASGPLNTAAHLLTAVVPAGDSGLSGALKLAPEVTAGAAVPKGDAGTSPTRLCLMSNAS